MRREGYDFGIMRGVTFPTFLPARHREVTCWYVSYWCFTLSLPRLHWQNQNVINKEVQISFRPILKTNGTMNWGSRVRTELCGSIIDSGVWEWKGFLNFTLCLDTRQPGTVFKKLDTRQWEILTNFLGIAHLIPLRTQDICLQISSDRKDCLGLKVEATVEFGHRVKS